MKIPTGTNKKLQQPKAFGNLIIDQDKEDTYASSILEQPCRTVAEHNCIGVHFVSLSWSGTM
jgi:hypothetical protein